jgi:hypothetical protein
MPGRKSSASSPRAKVYRLHFSRDWVSRSGPKRTRQTTMIFVLKKPALVEFVVFQVAPECRRIGRFRVAGRAGVNRVRFRRRIGRRLLGPGTYRIRARTLPRGRALVDTALVVFAHPQPQGIASARNADACRSRPRGQSTSSTASTPGEPSATAASPGRSKTEKPSRAHGVLGARFAERGVDAVKSIPLWLFALLGLAITLLAVAALPLRATPTRGAGMALAYHRGMVALGGAALLVAVTVAYALH